MAFSGKIAQGWGNVCAAVQSARFSPGAQGLTEAAEAGMMQAAQAGRAVAASPRGASRKVRTPQGTAPGKSREGATSRIGPQKQTAWIPGKGEKVV